MTTTEEIIADVHEAVDALRIAESRIFDAVSLRNAEMLRGATDTYLDAVTDLRDSARELNLWSRDSKRADESFLIPWDVYTLIRKSYIDGGRRLLAHLTSQIAKRDASDTPRNDLYYELKSTLGDLKMWVVSKQQAS